MSAFAPFYVTAAGYLTGDNLSVLGIPVDSLIPVGEGEPGRFAILFRAFFLAIFLAFFVPYRLLGPLDLEAGCCSSPI